MPTAPAELLPWVTNTSNTELLACIDDLGRKILRLEMDLANGRHLYGILEAERERRGLAS